MALRAVRTRQLFNPQCRLTAPLEDILCEYDVRVPMSDGTFVTVNIFRSRTAAADGERMPAVMCAHPYDNSLIPELGNTPFNGPPQQYRMIPQEGDGPTFSTLTSWESPDPNFWVDAGYAVVNMNMPGYASSGGKPTLFGEDQNRAFAEAIEWVGQQDWCTGGVGLSGVSYLAISQYGVAAKQSPHGVPSALKAICPWEGISDLYQDMFFEGGVEERGFPTFWWYTEVKPTINCSEAEFVASEGQRPHELAQTHPFYDEYWRAKNPDLESIELPMLICASFCDQGLHTRGSARAFRQARSPNKWLYTHRRLKWDAYYSAEVLQLTRQFFDRFVKGENNGFEQKARVRLEVRSARDTIHEVREESDWPLPQTRYERLYLSASSTLSPTSSANAAQRSYDAKSGSLRFSFRFEQDTELSGYMKLRLWVQARGTRPPRDMAIFVAVDKLDAIGEPVRFYGAVGSHNDTVARGLIQVSRRELDEPRSTEFEPVLRNQRELPLQAGEIVPLEIAIQPSSTFFCAGEHLQLIIAANVVVASHPFVKSTDCNHGVHVVHFGGEYDSHLLIPRIPAAETPTPAG
jgi:hypothetical protein|tara:strand:- start:269 stop:1996 length:1728 start_codon:yes stop_codon:yes gene_type:complete